MGKPRAATEGGGGGEGRINLPPPPPPSSLRAWYVGGEGKWQFGGFARPAEAEEKEEEGFVLRVGGGGDSSLQGGKDASGLLAGGGHPSLNFSLPFSTCDGAACCE